MTITSDYVSPLGYELNTDLLPGSTDVEWAERAFGRWPTPSDDHRAVRRSNPRRRIRILVAAIALLLAMAGLVILLTTSGSSAPTTTTPAVSQQAVTAPSGRVGSGHVTLTPPLLRPSPFTFPILTAPRR